MQGVRRDFAIPQLPMADGTRLAAQARVQHEDSTGAAPSASPGRVWAIADSAIVGLATGVSADADSAIAILTTSVFLIAILTTSAFLAVALAAALALVGAVSAGDGRVGDLTGGVPDGAGPATGDPAGMTRGGVLPATGTRRTATNTALRMRHLRTILTTETTTVTVHPTRRRIQIRMTSRRRQRRRTIRLPPPNPRPASRLLLRQPVHRSSHNRRPRLSQFPSCSTAPEPHTALGCAGRRVRSIRPTRGSGISYAT